MHFVADFIFQSDTVAKGKSTSNQILAWHVSLYAIPFFWFGWKFAVLNAVLHFITDWFTSRATSWLWQREQRHWFFVTIGFDQAIHMSCLFGTYLWLA
jgi:membrane-bound metal-dependent hydrolase YbcI (DUF457 family)